MDKRAVWQNDWLAGRWDRLSEGLVDEGWMSRWYRRCGELGKRVLR